MHSYGRAFQYTRYVHLALGAIAYAIHNAILAALPPALLPYSPVSFFTIFAICEIAFDQWGWHVLRLVPFLHVVSFQGKYQGVVCAGADRSEFAASLHIRQTWSRISVEFRADGSANARSISASILKDRVEFDHFELVYNYFARGKRDDDGQRFDHHGTAMLKLSASGRDLAGDYFTEQKRDTFGTIRMRRVKV